MKENDYVIWGVNIGTIKKHPDGYLYVHTTQGLHLADNLGWELVKNKKTINEIKEYEKNIIQSRRCTTTLRAFIGAFPRVVPSV